MVWLLLCICAEEILPGVLDAMVMIYASLFWTSVVSAVPRVWSLEYRELPSDVGDVALAGLSATLASQLYTMCSVSLSKREGVVYRMTTTLVQFCTACMVATTCVCIMFVMWSE